MRAKSKNSKRAASGRTNRHESAIEKYRNYQQSILGAEKLNDMIKGEQQNIHIPKSGEFMVVANENMIERSKYLEIPLKSLLDGTKTFTELQKKNVMEKMKLDGQSSLSRPITAITGKALSLKKYGNFDDHMEEELEFSEIYDENKDNRPVLAKKNNNFEAPKESKDAKPKISLTRNINFIVKKQQKQYLNPSSRVLHHVVAEKSRSPSPPLGQQTIKQITRIQSAVSNRIRMLSGKSNLPPARPLSSTLLLQSLAFENAEKLSSSNTLRCALSGRPKLLKEEENVEWDEGQPDRIQKKTEEGKREKERKKSSYIVSYVGRRPPKHIAGYEVVDLEKMRRDELRKPKYVHDEKESPFLYEDKEAERRIQVELGLPFPKEMRQPYEKRDAFLPLEYYLIVDDDELDQSTLLEKFKLENGKVPAFSRYFKPDGSFEWKSCDVQVWDKEEEKFLIKWKDGDKTKRVTRVNLRFALEDEDKFWRRLEEAERFRRISETYLKYNYIIDQKEAEPSQIMEESKERISFLVYGCGNKMALHRNVPLFLSLPPSIRFNSKRYIQNKAKPNKETLIKKKAEINFKKENEDNLWSEVLKERTRASKVYEFNMGLPYNEEYRGEFEMVMDDEMFEPICGRRRIETSTKGYIKIGKKIKNGQIIDLIKEMQKNLHQGNEKKLTTLRDLNLNFIFFSSVSFFINNYPKCFTLEEFAKLQQLKENETLREFKSRMYDTNFEIMELVEDEIRAMRKRNEERNLKIAIESDRKLLEEKEIPRQAVINLTNFQMLIQLKLEKALAALYHRSLQGFISDLEKIEDKLKEKGGFDLNDMKYENLFIYQKNTVFDKFDNTVPLLHIEMSFDSNMEIVYEPILETFAEKFENMIVSIKSKLLQMDSLKTKEIGAARETNIMQIFLEKDDPSIGMELRLRFLFSKLFAIPKMLQEKLKSFSFILETTPESLKKKMKKYDFQEFNSEIIKLKGLQNDLETYLFESNLKSGIFLITIDQIKKTLTRRLHEFSQTLTESLLSRITHQSQKLSSSSSLILTRLKTPPTNIEEMNDLRLFIKNELPSILKDTQAKIFEIQKKTDLLESMRYRMSPEEFQTCWSCHAWPRKLWKKKEKALQTMVNKEKLFIDDLMKQQGELSYTVLNIKNDLEILARSSDIRLYETIATDFFDLGERISAALKEADLINLREDIVQYKKSDYSEILRLKQSFQPYFKVWSLARESEYKLPQILNSNLSNLDRDLITEEVQEAWKELYKMEKGVFKLVPHMLKVTVEVRKKFEAFKQYLPLINDLRNPGLKARHWHKLASIMGVEIEDNNFLKLSDLIKKGVMDLKDQIRDISEIATKEQGIEKILNKMKSDWKIIKFELIQFRDTGCPILRAIDPILDKLDEDIVKINTISASPYIEFLKVEVSSWRSILLRAQDTVDLWVKVQRSWQYLQPIFFSEEIIKNMDQEGRKYSAVDKIWRGIMTQTEASPGVMDCCGQAKLKETFETCLEQLDQVMKGLTKFLNDKRSCFPRFFFLSNDELISILAQAREPLTVQKYMNKCFEGIEKLIFDENCVIKGMISREEESVPFLQEIKAKEEENIRGVEEWMGEVEKMMKLSLKTQLPKVLIDYSKENRQKWLFDYPSQLIIVSDMILWTHWVTSAILSSKSNKNAYKELSSLLQENLLQIVQMVRSPLTPRHAITLGVLIILEVHAKDIVDSLSLNSVTDLQDFNWLSQMRYTLESKKTTVKIKKNTVPSQVLQNVQNSSAVVVGKEELVAEAAAEGRGGVVDFLDPQNPSDYDFFVKMVNTHRFYGFEYLGNQNRLVITPLTDRCFRTLMSALQMTLGGSPEGPAGTGKTESVKDLAKALAKHCVVFNCSDQLDIGSMAKFFKGLLACGSWACFDEFNRIELEVLSVIAQQILIIQTALLRIGKREEGGGGGGATGGGGSKREEAGRAFTFEGTGLIVDPSCAIFTTMNPGYAGRSELPDNLKALFRPVAMMIPDYKHIAEISLYSFGYVGARKLAGKLVLSLRVASEQLSTQKHYDFGMRAVKAILGAARNLKREGGEKREEEEEVEEERMVRKAIGGCNFPKLVREDVGLFEAILQDLFGGKEEGGEREVKKREEEERRDEESNEEGKEEGKDEGMEVRKVEQNKEEQKEQEEDQEEGEEEKVRKGVKEVGEIEHLTLDRTMERKVMELYETIRVRHGVMIVGETLSGKTTIMNTLASALGLKNKKNALKHQVINHSSQILEKRGSQEAIEQFNEREKFKYPRVLKYPVNPKAITDKFLYGYSDPASGEWQDGVCAKLFRDCLDGSDNLKWLVFDGPVDSLWIENLNTVLDDNKKLCLANGETIKMSDTMTVLFEVEDLIEASPATVSRCGMVYLESSPSSLPSLLSHWASLLPPTLSTPSHIALYSNFFSEVILPFLLPSSSSSSSSFNSSSLVIHPSSLLLSFLRLLESLLLKDKTKEEVLLQIQMENEKEEARQAALRLEGKESAHPIPNSSTLLPKEKTEVLGSLIMALIWSIGCLKEEKGRTEFEKELRKRVENMENEREEGEKGGGVGTGGYLPDKDVSIFDVYWSAEKRMWVLWKSGGGGAGSWERFHEVYVPNRDGNRVQGIAKRLIKHNFPVLFIGRTGTGKTVSMKRVIMEEMEGGKMVATMTSFSANTKCYQVQDILESKLEKTKRKKGVFGPLLGTKNIIFIDDLNMPNKDEYGSQPPLELIRQWFTLGGWFDRKTLDFKTIVDIQFAGAMGLGRAEISKRIIRHFNVVYLPEMEADTMVYIMKTILDWGYNGYIDKVKSCIQVFCKLTLRTYKFVSSTFLPLPRKAHYLFNFRDLTKILQGLLAVPAIKYEAQSDIKQQLARLWVHESLCVYSDRLIEDQDKALLLSELSKSISDELNLPFPSPPILFGNFMEPHSISKPYVEIDDQGKLKLVIHEYIEEYNTLSKHKLDLVLFEDALSLLCKINRIISQPFGNALLVGLGGSGRHCLSRLATYMQDYHLFEIEMESEFNQNEWLEFLKEMLKFVGISNKPAVFLVGEANIVEEFFMEDINNLLNVGEIPKLYTPDEKENLLSEIKEQNEHQGRKNMSFLALWEQFISNCKSNLHIILCLSPIGSSLRLRFRNFPSFVSCTSIIWLLPWSSVALASVATHFLMNSETMMEVSEKENKNALDNFQKTELQHIPSLDENTESKINETIENPLISKLSRICRHFHEVVMNYSEQYQREHNKFNYVTPISFTQMLKKFISLHESTTNSLITKKEGYLSGVEKLQQCSEMVDTMSNQLEALKPVLVSKTKETEEIMKNIEIETAEAEKQRLQVQADEMETSKKAEIAADIQSACKEKLSEAEPDLEAAIGALKTLKMQDFVEMKALLKPPVLIVLTMDAVCIMMERKPKKTQTKAEDYWDEAKKLLSEPNKFIKLLENYKRDSIPEKVIQRMGRFLEENPKFQPSIVKNASEAAEGLCKWVKAIYKYHHVFKAIQPLREDLAKANETLRIASEELEAKRKLLEAVEEKCKSLNDNFSASNFAKQKLKAQITDCELKLQRAKKLTTALGGEREIWLKEAQHLSEDLYNVIGNTLLSVGFISYLGGFRGTYREKIIQSEWIPKIQSESINCSGSFDIKEKMANSIQIQEWLRFGLPMDNVSIENQIIMGFSDRWPLLVDPQGQGRRFIKKWEGREDEKRIYVCKPNRNFDKQLENALRMGLCLIIENVGETLDPILDNVLLKNIQKRGNFSMINLGSNLVDYNSDFRLYLITSLPTPHFPPEVQTKVSLLDFSITSDGLLDQLLSLLVKEEEPKDEDDKIRMINENSAARETQRNLEAEILDSLRKADGSKILDDEILIRNLTESKAKSEEIEVKIAGSKVMEERINANRNAYESVARMAAHLYFSVLGLEKLDSMYQFSLEFFIRIFRKSIKSAEKPAQKSISRRVLLLLDSFKKSLFFEISRSIFVKHKLLFSFMIAIAQLQCQNALPSDELNFLLTGTTGRKIESSSDSNEEEQKHSKEGQIKDNKNSTLSFLLSEKQMNDLMDLCQIPKFSQLPFFIQNNPEVFETYLFNLEKGELPSLNGIPPFSSLVLGRVLRPASFLKNLREFIKIVIGDYFVENLVIPLESSWKESTATLPLLFLLSQGDDPQDDVKKLAQEKGKILIPLSLGKGQGDSAEANIKDAIINGYWVLLQNCHLALSWLPKLETLFESLSSEKRLHSDFRLWLTTFSDPNFSRILTQESIKITKDPPRGVKANLSEIYGGIISSKGERTFFNGCQKMEEWQKLFLGLAFFHGVVRERRRFGPIGWNVGYDFNDSDFRISMRQLQHILNNYEIIPFQALIYLTGECYYGGKVTDEWDRRVLIELLKTFYNEIVVYEDYKFCKIEQYHIPDDISLDKAMEYIQTVPENDHPEVFGLHPNASITSALFESDFIINSLLNISPKTENSQSSDKSFHLKSIVQDLQKSLPLPFDIDECKNRYPISYFDSMNTVLLQELMRYNSLLNHIRSSLSELKQALEGTKSMTSTLDSLSSSLLSNTLPPLFLSRSYPSLRPLSSYFRDLIKRIEMFKNWIASGPPKIFWLPGFFFTQSFFTGVLQNFARKQKISIENMGWKVVVKGGDEKLLDELGVEVNGLWLEGGKWNKQEGRLEDGIEGDVFFNMPEIRFIPREIKEGEEEEKEENVYKCPIYKTIERKGTLSTTGHSTNFIISIKLPCEKNEGFWVKRGTALITQLND